MVLWKERDDETRPCQMGGCLKSDGSWLGLRCDDVSVESANARSCPGCTIYYNSDL